MSLGPAMQGNLRKREQVVHKASARKDLQPDLRAVER